MLLGAPRVRGRYTFRQVASFVAGGEEKKEREEKEERRGRRRGSPR